MPGAEVVAVADTNEGSLSAAKALLEGESTKCRFTESFEEVLEDPEVDAVLIATPNFHHVRVLRKAIPAGKSILCEKPLCVSVAECAEILHLLEESSKYALFDSDTIEAGCGALSVSASSAPSRVFWVGMEYRYYPSISRLIKEVHGGTCGKLHMLSIREHRFPFLAKVGNWNRFRVNTGDTLVEKACHFFDLMRVVVGAEPESIYATGAQSVNHLDEKYDPEKIELAGGEVLMEKKEDGGRLLSDILDNAYVVVNFEDGTRALLDICMFAEASKHQEEIAAVGRKGKVEAFAPSHGQKGTSEGSFVRIGRRNEWESRATAPDPEKMQPLEVIQTEIEARLMEAGDHGGATYYEQRDFCDACSLLSREMKERGQQRPKVGVGARDGVLAVLMGIAAHRSIAEGRVVRMEEMYEELRKEAKKRYS